MKVLFVNCFLNIGLSKGRDERRGSSIEVLAAEDEV